MSESSLLTTKLFPPPIREQTVARDRLLQRLRPRPGVKLTMVAAPAGYGKTTLLCRWRDAEARAPERPVAWLSLDEADDDPVVLWSYVLEALKRSCPDLDTSLSPERLGAPRIGDIVLPHLVNELAEQGTCALILDDFHRLSNGPARDGIAWLIEHGPSTFQLVLSSRSEPALPLPRLRARGALTELRAQDLAFSTDEADGFLNGSLRLGLAREDVSNLVDRVEGWPAGLYLAALSLQEVEDRPAFVRRFGGANRHVIDFLLDDVLEAHEPATQRGMLHTLILERLSGPLCDAVLERENSADMLDALARTNLFFIPLDDRGEWYRFHHLFAELLRVELAHREPGLALELYRRAYAWHREYGSADEAIEYAVRAEMYEEAGDLIAASWVQFANVSRYASLLTVLRRFPDDVFMDNSLLLLVQAWVLSLSDRKEEASRAIAAVERLGDLERGPLPDGFGSLESSLVTLEASLPWGDVGAGLDSAIRATQLEGAGSLMRSTVCWARGMGLYYSGEFEQADRWFAESVEVGQVDEMSLVVGSSLAYRSLIAGEQGGLDDQMSFAERAVTFAREHGIEETDGEVFVAQGVALAARGKLDDALPYLARGVDVLRSFGQPIDLANAEICHAAALLAVVPQSV